MKYLFAKYQLLLMQLWIGLLILVPAVFAEPPTNPTLAPTGTSTVAPGVAPHADESNLDFMSMVFVFMLATFIGIGVIQRVSRLLHTPLMSLTNAISAI